jgi:hypothetical protein
MANEEPEYRSIKVTKRAYDALMSLRDELYEHGMALFPAELRPAGSRTVSLSTIIELGVLTARRFLKKGGGKT